MMKHVLHLTMDLMGSVTPTSKILLPAMLEVGLQIGNATPVLLFQIIVHLSTMILLMLLLASP
jgi:hypothetical protein